MTETRTLHTDGNPLYCVPEANLDALKARIVPDFFMRKWYYVADDGSFQEVTIGKQQRFSNSVEQPFHFAVSAIIAGGKQVGEVTYTDH